MKWTVRKKLYAGFSTVFIILIAMMAVVCVPGTPRSVSKIVRISEKESP
ncbi:hypothetical protein JEG43_07235 [Anoxybacillus sp. LAT_35]|nr:MULTISPECIES: hypothetical protein [unclassified Anoxybacillus]MCG5026250.1 hypothetical protein [Anoxybacillus flavithermus]MCG6196554.1 hypothetical protein [Anoxybacillus sp. LAT_38]MCG3084249.1 hypothetical protein [Anoxybacillus sp. LAT27]MCG6172303.1 hypothetical protein [Anoxybacillus sp. LAT_11]MCG6175989.1 hypothetical protein [Anoxybacillus sp. LAT_31]